VDELDDLSPLHGARLVPTHQLRPAGPGPQAAPGPPGADGGVWPGTIGKALSSACSTPKSAAATVEGSTWDEGAAYGSSRSGSSGGSSGASSFDDRGSAVGGAAAVIEAQQRCAALAPAAPGAVFEAGRHIVVEIKTTNALPLLKYACTPRVVALPTAQINASRVGCGCVGRGGRRRPELLCAVTERAPPGRQGLTAGAWGSCGRGIIGPHYLRTRPLPCRKGLWLSSDPPKGSLGGLACSLILPRMAPSVSRSLLPIQLAQLIKRPYASMVSQALLNFESSTNVFVMPPRSELEGCRCHDLACWGLSAGRTKADGEWCMLSCSS
jgi:hypothetical protein